MKIGMIQHNPTVGDVWGNVKAIFAGYQILCDQGAEFVVSPELGIIGYPPKDLLSRKRYIDEQLEALNILAGKLHPDIPLVVGVADYNPHDGRPLLNRLIVLHRGRSIFKQNKRLLPNYDVFDEARYFEPDPGWIQAFEFKGLRFCSTICEDIWYRIETVNGHKRYQDDPIEAIKRLRPDIMINISASPYHWGKGDIRYRLISDVARTLGCTVLYCNQAGGNDELVFDGRSMAIDKNGVCFAIAEPFRPQLLLVETDTVMFDDVMVTPDTGNLNDVKGALVLGLRDYARKTGFERAVLGLSGGIDSALVATLAAEALGPENVLGVAMPSPYSDPISEKLAAELAGNLRIQFDRISIEEMYAITGKTLKPHIGWYEPGTNGEDVTEENIQARLRGLTLMAISNRYNSLLLSTGNKSETAVGYCTLYGDTNGGLAVIADVPKTLVQELSAFLNRDKIIIPEGILKRPPSAELRKNQKDEDTLPPYPVLDRILHLYVEKEMDADDIIITDPTLDPHQVQWVAQRVDRNEFKRRQTPPCLKVTSKSFGFGWRYPLAFKRLG